MRIATRNNKIILTITCIIVGISISVFLKDIKGEDPASTTQHFIEKYMTNPNGTLASFLIDDGTANPDFGAGREALSESLGIWMQYAVEKQNADLFKQSYDILRNKFLSPKGYVFWKLRADGQPMVNTNALGDDFRIIDALLKAYDLWKQEEYLSIAEGISTTLMTSVRTNGYFVDYHDFSINYSSNSLSLVYVDASAMQSMKQHKLMDQVTYEKHMDLLLNMPVDGVFYPKLVDVNTKQYAFDKDVNLIDQLIVAIHSAELGMKPDRLIQFLKTEMDQNHKLFGRYNRTSKVAAVDYESPAVYGLAVLLALKSNDSVWAEQLNTHMLSFRDKDLSFKGGYVFSQNAHMFDNLIPLLAETSLHQATRK
jgi:endo-1,4-beta-D-glucanase Y